MAKSKDVSRAHGFKMDALGGRALPTLLPTLGFVMHSPRTFTLLFSFLLLFLARSTASLSAAEEPAKGRPALPGEPCLTKPRSSWTKQEKWVWNQVCVGKIANFNEAEGYGGQLDPKKPEGWPKSRVLRPAFLETILLHEPYRSAVLRQGVRIVGAWFKETLDLSEASLAFPLWLDDSRFESTVDLSNFRTPHLISLEGSKFAGKLNMALLQVGADFFMGKAAEFAEVVLRGADVRGHLLMDGSKFTGFLNMDSLQIGGDLLMREGAEFANVVLARAKVGGQLWMDGAKFAGPLNMDSLHVGSHFFMLNVEANNFGPLLIFAEIDGGLNLSGSTLASLNLTAARIRGELGLNTRKDTPTKWQEGANLTLRNTEVGALQDLPNTWPENLDLNGFTYSHLGGFATGDGNDMATWDIAWLTEWLEKQKSYSPQPYEQLASVLRRAGYEDKANDILYAGRQRERKEEASWPRWAWLVAQEVVIGYGYRIYFAFGWVILFVGVGACIFRSTREARFNRMPYGIAYSFDMLLPLVKLRENHYSIDLKGCARYYFYFHKLAGYVLASFLIAGLSGLTK